MKSKKGSGLMWFLIILILIAIGIGIYFWISGGDTTPVVNGGSSIPSSLAQPPAFPL